MGNKTNPPPLRTILDPPLVVSYICLSVCPSHDALHDYKIKADPGNESSQKVDRPCISAVDCPHAAPQCTCCVQDCNSAIEHGGGPADKVMLNLAMTRVKKMTSSSHVKRRHGVGALGYAVVQPDQRVPDNDFFEPQRIFRVRFRFVSFTNTACLPCVVCCSQSFFLLRNRSFIL